MAPTTIPYNTLDVFTTTRFSGNQLGLVHLPSPSALTQAQKQAIATEINYSETVFLYPKSSSPTTDSEIPVYAAQIFTPKSEIPFAGHPTIGTAVYIFSNLEKDQDVIALDLKAGRMQISYDHPTGIAKASIAHDICIHGVRCMWQSIIETQPNLGNAAPESWANESFPLVSIVPGMTWMLGDLTSQPELLNHVAPTPKDPFTPEWLDEGRWRQGFTGSLFYKIYPPESSDAEGLIRVRQRMMGIGIEDPATGSASCALASYLALTERRDVHVEIEQGVEMGRASKIFVKVKVKEKDDGYVIESVELSGQAVEVASGSLRVDR